MPKLFMVFDVEAVGLHGEGFAFGYVVVNRAGKTLDQSMAACPPDQAAGDPDGRAWVRDNVPALHTGCSTPREVRDEFWRSWTHWKAEGAVLVADCAWPVEARFLAACVDDAPHERAWEGPYPLHDVASVLLALGRDPLKENERLPSELPAHHPAKDAQQSARLLIAALSQERLAAGVEHLVPVHPNDGADWDTLHRGADAPWPVENGYEWRRVVIFDAPGVRATSAESIAAAEAEDLRDVDGISDLLSLVGYDAPADVVATWTLEERQAAQEWAAATHLQASDNDVDVPARPRFLPEPWTGPMQGEGIWASNPTLLAARVASSE